MKRLNWLLAVVAFTLFSNVVLAEPRIGLMADDAAPAITYEKSELKILFVGHNPEDPQVPFKDLATDRTYELYKERTAAYEAFLKDRFENVRVVYGPDYTADMSDTVDVTIFDARPKPLTPAKREADNYTPASYLPADFDRPALLIAENSPRIGEALGLKLDWL